MIRVEVQPGSRSESLWWPSLGLMPLAFAHRVVTNAGLNLNRTLREKQSLEKICHPAVLFVDARFRRSVLTESEKGIGVEVQPMRKGPDDELLWALESQVTR